ncbi:MAG: hypothetical protein HRU20_20280 [Pseudomonadales bacterium]|nr:hypothetical protein [Pseudomonadales bacterium]
MNFNKLPHISHGKRKGAQFYRQRIAFESRVIQHENPKSTLPRNKVMISTENMQLLLAIEDTEMAIAFSRSSQNRLQLQNKVLELRQNLNQKMQQRLH